MPDLHASRTLCSPRLRASVFVVLLLLASIPTLATPAVAGTASLTLAWDASPDPSTVDGYIIEWGHRRGTYTDEVEVGVDVTSYTINGLVDGRRYYIIVRSTAAEVVSAPSNEVSGVATAPPPIPEPEPEPEAEPEVEAEPEPEPDSSSDGKPGKGKGRGKAKRKHSAISPDFDADSMDDLGVYRPSRGEWHVRGSSGLELFVNDVENSGANTVPVTADFDGDGAADIASWNPSDGTWVVHTSGNGYRRSSSYRLGSGQSIPVPADYDGDGAAEIAVFEPDGRWRVQGGQVRKFGKRGDIPVPSDYDGDGQIDLAVYRPSTSMWYVRDQFRVTFGDSGDEPIPLDTDGDGRAEIVVYRPSNATWLLFNPSTGASDQIRYGERGDVPVGIAPFRALASGSDGDSTRPESDSAGG